MNGIVLLMMCKHSIRRQMYRDKDGIFFARYCTKCNKIIERLELSDAPKSYIQLIYNDGFLTYGEAKMCLEILFMESVMGYNIHKVFK